MQVDLATVSPTSEITNVKRPKAAAPENVEAKEVASSEKLSNIKKTETEKLQELQKSLANQNIALRFSRDADTKVLIVEMVDDKTGEAILQLPSKVSLKLAAEHAKLQGLFVNKTV